MFSLSQGDRPGFDNVAVIITDGRSDDEESTWREAIAAREAGIEVRERQRARERSRLSIVFAGCLCSCVFYRPYPYLVVQNDTCCSNLSSACRSWWWGSGRE